MLGLLPLPNDQSDPSTGNAWAANNAIDTTPDHIRKNVVIRLDSVLSQRTRFSVRGVFDRDDAVQRNAIMPGVGNADNIFPGNLLSGTLTQVIKPTVVNEMTIGWTENHFGWTRNPGPLQATDYTDWWRGANNPDVGLIPDPPRLGPFGAYATRR